MSPSFAILLGIFIGAIVGALLGIFLVAGKTKTEQRLREQAELSAREQLAALRKELDRTRAESEARSYQVRQLDASLATQSTLATESQKRVAALEQHAESTREQLLVATQTEKRQAEEISRLSAELQNERQGAVEKLKLLTDAQYQR